MAESSAWSTLRKNLDGSKQRFEDKLAAGIPDTNWKSAELDCDVWLEGKHLKDWPVRPTTPVRVGLRKEQALWLKLRKRVGGKCFVWVRVPRRTSGAGGRAGQPSGWYLFDGGFDKLRDGMPFDEFDMHGEYFATCGAMVAHIKETLK